MGLFQKKFCNFCGQKIGLLQNTKLQDGNLCKNCRELLSPFYMIDYESPTVDEIGRQLAYRQQNYANLQNFHPNRSVGDVNRLFVDEMNRTFVLATEAELRTGNPDIFTLDSVREASVATGEDLTNDEDADGRPTLTAYSYNIYLNLAIDHSFLPHISMRTNTHAIQSGRKRIREQEMQEIYEGTRQLKTGIFGGGKAKEEYLRYYAIAQDMAHCLLGYRMG